MVFGTEIEWSGDRKTRKAEDDEVVLKIWGHAVPCEGYLAAILYDFGRLLAINPPSMVLVTHPPPDEDPEPVVREARAMYERASSEGRKGALSPDDRCGERFPSLLPLFAALAIPLGTRCETRVQAPHTCQSFMTGHDPSRGQAWGHRGHGPAAQRSPGAFSCPLCAGSEGPLPGRATKMCATLPRI